MFELQATDHQARAGILRTAHGDLETPFFMTIATAGSVKGVTVDQLRSAGVPVVLGNTYHLHLKPGEDIIHESGGLHAFMGWDGPILTDSGGYQVFSLAKLRKITERGVTFQSHLDGKKIELTPEKSIVIQEKIGADIIMCFDECPPYPATEKYARESLKLTTAWAERCKKAHKRKDQLLFGIVQGSTYPELRAQSARELRDLGFDGYAIGGLAVGEPVEMMYQILDITAPQLPENTPRYLMGVGTPENILEAVERGVDMFDCVLPTRNARHGFLYTSHGIVRIRNEKYQRDFRPLDPHCSCYTCAHHSRAYLRHLHAAQEYLAITLCSIHNIHFYQWLMNEIRSSILEKRFSAFKESFLAQHINSPLDRLSIDQIA